MSDEQSFRGFPRDVELFFAELAENNERPWFQAHKEIYQERVLGPAQAFVAELGPRLAKIGSGVRWDTRTNGSGSIFRIYRDTRFSKDKSPYKTSLDIRFWSGPSKVGGAGFYFGLNGTEAVFYGGAYQFAKDQMEPYRQAVTGRRGARLPGILNELSEAGFTLAGTHYKRVPRGFDADHPRADLLRHAGLWARAPKILKRDSRSRSLLDVCEAHALRMKSLHAWLNKTFDF